MPVWREKGCFSAALNMSDWARLLCPVGLSGSPLFNGSKVEQPRRAPCTRDETVPPVSRRPWLYCPAELLLPVLRARGSDSRQPRSRPKCRCWRLVPRLRGGGFACLLSDPFALKLQSFRFPSALLSRVFCKATSSHSNVGRKVATLNSKHKRHGSGLTPRGTKLTLDWIKIKVFPDARWVDSDNSEAYPVPE